MGTDAGGGDTDAGMTGTDAGDRDSAVPPMGDGNDSFADADPIELGADPTMGRIGTPGDGDYYSFEGTAGQWMILSTEANPDDDPEMVDTVITLYDSSMTQIAENDDSVPRFNTDSELITRLPSDGTYYVLVREFSDWAGETPEGQADFNYSLSVASLNTGATAVNLDAEGGNDVASAQALGYNVDTSDFGIVVGDFADGSDVDVFSFSVAGGKNNIQFEMMPSTADGYGSTSSIGRLWITNGDGSEIIARIAIDETNGLTEIQPNLPDGDYNVFVENDGAPGANGFYVLKAYRFGTDNDPETDDTANDDVSTPDALTVMDDEGVRRGFILATLGDGDTDHFSFELMDGEQINVFCGSATAGSGVQGLSATVLMADGTEVSGASGTETATDGIAIEEVTAAAGTYVLRLTKTGQDAEVTGNWVRCGVAMAPPAP